MSPTGSPQLNMATPLVNFRPIVSHHFHHVVLRFCGSLCRRLRPLWKLYCPFSQSSHLCRMQGPVCLLGTFCLVFILINDSVSFSSISSSTFESPQIGKKWTNLPNATLTNDFGLLIIKDGVVFSPAVEDFVQRHQMLSDAEVDRLLKDMRTLRIADLQESAWDKCGRPKNQWVELGSEGRAACARYRYPNDKLLVGEILCFYLSRMLGVGMVLPVVLSYPSDSRWDPVASQKIKAQWGNAPVVSLTPWQPDLVRDEMPTLLLSAVLSKTTLGVRDITGLRSDSRQMFKGQRYTRGSKGRLKPMWVPQRVSETPKNTSALKHLSNKELKMLVQWSDLIVFDYLTGNYDRVAYMFNAAEQEKDVNILRLKIHNVLRTKTRDELVLIDNESGLIDSYIFLYGSKDHQKVSRYKSYHTQMLKSICVFRKSTMEAVLALSLHPEPHNLLVDFVNQFEPLFHQLPDPLYKPHFVRHFSHRIKEVRNWMENCIEKVREIDRSKQ